MIYYIIYIYIAKCLNILVSISISSKEMSTTTWQEHVQTRGKSMARPWQTHVLLFLKSQQPLEHVLPEGFYFVLQSLPHANDFKAGLVGRLGTAGNMGQQCDVCAILGQDRVLFH